MKNYPVVVIESPFKGGAKYSEKDNAEFAEWLCRDFALRGFNPIASHVYYTQFLKDKAINERTLGIHMGLQKAAALDPILATFNLRLGEDHSSGMSIALDFWRIQGVPRMLIKWDERTVIPDQGHGHIWVPVAVDMLDV